MPQQKPLYIAFEGGEGSGKSTQASLLVDRIGESAVLTKEPGGTPAGLKLREILLSPDTKDLDPMAEAFLMAADRCQLTAQIVRPNLANGRHVISDRTFASGIAYQGAGRGLGEQTILNLNLINQGLVLPDIMFVLLPPSPKELARRMNRDLDRFEQAGDEFHTKVAECFGRMASILEDSRTSEIEVVTLTAGSYNHHKTPEEVHQEVTDAIRDYCEVKKYSSPV